MLDSSLCDAHPEALPVADVIFNPGEFLYVDEDGIVIAKIEIIPSIKYQIIC